MIPGIVDYSNNCGQKGFHLFKSVIATASPAVGDRCDVRKEESDMMTIVFGTLVLAVAAVAAVTLIAFLDVAFHPPEYSLAAVRKDNTLSSLRTRDLFVWFSETAQSMTRSLISAQRDATTAAPRNSSERLEETFDVRACSSRTAATPEEILEIAGYLRETQSPETVDAIRWQAKQNSRAVAEEGRTACSSHRCPLLCEDGTCMALPVRPIQCRVRCEMLGRSIPFADDDERARIILDGTEAGVSQALNESGRSTELYELNSGLGQALSVPDAAEKWESGENLFEECIPYRGCTASAN
jgi:hypothetical protein